MSNRVSVQNLKPVNLGFSSVTTSATALTYTQLPSIVCDEVVFTRTPTTNAVPVIAAFSATPAAGAILYVASGVTQTSITIPTGLTRNANALFLTNESGTNALIVSFMYLVYDNDRAPFPTTRGTAG
jgi:hypothetical protein